ncbi:MAG: hypothetical protein KJ722_00695 [Candidatus Omnitrophica bacterium]|nr:hypothetical protein [Candidatus Omnitrophota bacterium]
MKKQNSLRGQSTIEYAVVIIIVVAALMAMFGFLKRHIQGGYRESADSIGAGRQYQK